MPGVLDPVTLGGLVIGLRTGAGFLLVAAGIDGAGSRRLVQRVEALKGSKKAAATGAAAARSLSRRDNATRMDNVARRWLPRRDMLIVRLERTGRPIAIGKYMDRTIALSSILAMIVMTFAGFEPPPRLRFG